MSQRERRREPYPWTWEPAAAVSTILVAVVVGGAQLGRAAANLAAGCALAFPPAALGWVTSTPAVLAGDPTAGLTATGGRAAGTATLAWSVAVTAVLLLGLTLAALIIGWRRWGPGGVQGVARPGEARAALGVHRLRRTRRLLRPDLYARRTRGQG